MFGLRRRVWREDAGLVVRKADNLRVYFLRCANWGFEWWQGDLKRMEGLYILYMLVLFLRWTIRSMMNRGCAARL